MSYGVVDDRFVEVDAIMEEMKVVGRETCIQGRQYRTSHSIEEYLYHRGRGETEGGREPVGLHNWREQQQVGPA